MTDRERKQVMRFTNGESKDRALEFLLESGQFAICACGCIGAPETGFCFDCGLVMTRKELAPNE